MKLFITRFYPAKRQSTGRFVISGSFVRRNANPPDKLPFSNITFAAHHLKTKKSELGAI